MTSNVRSPISDFHLVTRHLSLVTFCDLLPFEALLRPRVRDPQQHVGVARLVERAPAGEIFAPQAVANIAFVEVISEVLLV